MNKLLKIPVDKPGDVYINPTQVVRVTALRLDDQEHVTLELSDGETFAVLKTIEEVTQALGCELSSELAQ